MKCFCGNNATYVCIDCQMNYCHIHTGFTHGRISTCTYCIDLEDKIIEVNSMLMSSGGDGVLRVNTNEGVLMFPERFLDTKFIPFKIIREERELAMHFNDMGILVGNYDYDSNIEFKVLLTSPKLSWLIKKSGEVLWGHNNEDEIVCLIFKTFVQKPLDDMLKDMLWQ